MKKTALVSLLLMAAASIAFAQGAPSPEGQSVSAKGEASADSAVAAKKAKRAAKKSAKAAKSASAASM